jgi:hypothetical protein
MTPLLTTLAWAAAIATVIYQRALVPLTLLVMAELLPPQEPSQRPIPDDRTAAKGQTGIITLRPVTPEALAGLTCRQLRAMAGTRRHLPKQHLIAMVLHQQPLAS